MKNTLSASCFRRCVILLVVIPSVLSLFGTGTTQAQDFVSITAKNLRQHMDSIASDATEGRFTGSSGYTAAARYAAGIFERAGLVPGCVNGKGEKSYFQPVPFVRNNYSPATSIAIRKNGKTRAFPHSAENFVFIDPGKKYTTRPMGPVVFLGYGIHEPGFGWDDYAGVDVEGKWVVLLNGIPPADSTIPVFPDTLRKRYSDWKISDSLKFDALIRNKAAGVIGVPDKYAAENWNTIVIQNYLYNYVHYSDGQKNIASKYGIPLILVHPDLAEFLLAGQAYDPLVHKGSYRTFTLEATEILVAIDIKEEQFVCQNVVAIVPGTDPVRKNDFITVGAHLDHIGKIGEQVYNGANDDASGCVIILEAAKQLAIHPAGRSVLFVLYAGEEMNLTGSKHFLKYPPVPIEHILVNINIEQIGSKHRDIPGIWAISPPQFKESFFKAGATLGESNLKFDPIDSFLPALKGSDFWSFYEKGIPAIMLSSGGFSDHHTVRDKIDLIDFDHLQSAARVLYLLTREAANN